VSGLKNKSKSIFMFNTENRRDWVAREAAKLKPGTRVLDVGAGSGQYRPLFSHCDYKAQDFAQEPGTIGHYTQLDYVSDIVSIPAEDASFDAILCTEVIEHVPDPGKALEEMGRLLRPGGRLILSAPLHSHLHQEPYHFYGGYTPYWYREFLGRAGMQVVSLEKNEGFFSYLGQEMRRFSAYTNPFRRHFAKMNVFGRLGLAALWLSTLPLSRTLPLIGYWLDRHSIEELSTVGYHVVAEKVDPSLPKS
jgi:ubiquinone/menaquinone biosynthesis C-methylase UbiE